MNIFCLVLVLLLLCGCAAAPEPNLPLTEPKSTSPVETQMPAQIPSQPTLPPEPSDPLAQVLDCLPLEEQVGQLFLIHHPRTEAIETIENCPPWRIFIFRI